MPTLTEVAVVTYDDRTPTGLESHPKATEAWQVHQTLVKKVENDPSVPYEHKEHAGIRGYRFRLPSLLSVMKARLPGHGDEWYADIFSYLEQTGNLRQQTGKTGSRGARYWWVPVTWQDVSPAQARRDQRRTGPASWAVADDDEGQEDPFKDPGIPDPGQVLWCCRFCTKTFTDTGSNGTRVSGRQAWLSHEHDAHPGEFAARFPLICPVGECRWPCPDREIFNTHVSRVHARTSRADQDTLAGQAAVLAAKPLQPAASPAPATAAAEPATSPDTDPVVVPFPDGPVPQLPGNLAAMLDAVTDPAGVTAAGLAAAMSYVQAAAGYVAPVLARLAAAEQRIEELQAENTSLQSRLDAISAASFDALENGLPPRRRSRKTGPGE